MARPHARLSGRTVVTHVAPLKDSFGPGSGLRVLSTWFRIRSASRPSMYAAHGVWWRVPVLPAAAPAANARVPVVATTGCKDRRTSCSPRCAKTASEPNSSCASLVVRRGSAGEWARRASGSEASLAAGQARSARRASTRGCQVRLRRGLIPSAANEAPMARRLFPWPPS